MNINKSFMEKHIFNQKTPENYQGGAANIDNSTPYSSKILTGGVPINHLLSKDTPHIKSLSHLGVPAGLITRSFPTIGGGKSLSQTIATKHISYNNELANKLFSKIEHPI